MKDNGNTPAFGYGFANEKDHQEVPGLTKREYFAAMAMQGLLASMAEKAARGNWGTEVNELANASVKIADELLKQLYLNIDTK